MIIDTDTPQKDTALAAALYYLDHNCFVVPCCPLDQQRQCLVHTHTGEKDVGKRPICGDNWQDLRLTREGINHWWTQYPTANVGVLLAPSGLIVLDIDSLEAELEASAKGLPPGPQVKTGRGVQHYYRNTRHLQGRAIQVGESHAIDILSNGIVIGAGSHHRTGIRYQWRVSFEEWELEDAPQWATALLREEEASPLHVDALPDELPHPDLTALGIEPWIIQVIQDGQPHAPFTPYPSRSHALWAVICGLVHTGFDTTTIAGILLDPTYAISAKPREQGAQWLARDIARAREKIPRASLNGHDQPAPMMDEEWADTTKDEDPPAADETKATEELPDDPHIRFTDLGNGQRFARRYGEILRFCTTWKSFLVWDGKRWARDQKEQVSRWARETIFGIYEEGQHYATRATQETIREEDRKRYALKAEGLLKHAVKSENGARIKEMMNLVKMDITILPDRLDADPWVINCINGTVDLHSGKLHPHQRDEYLTKITQVVYDPQARCPLWEAFLERIMDGRQDLIAYLQRAAGYSLTGDTREQCFFLGYGTGQNGKSVYINTLRDLCGDYGQQAAFSSFLHSDRETVRNDLAALRGARYVSAVEGGEGKRLGEAIIKVVTGNDPLTVRFLFQEYFSFLPQFKLWLGTNHKPVIKGTDLAIWRRIQMIPFTVTIPPEERDDHLDEKLKQEWPGILAWAVRGCLAWQRDGLQVPESVRAATSEYRAEMDVFSGWLNECCTQLPQLSTKAGDLFLSYKQWANDKDITQTAFGRRLRERGFIRDHNSFGYVIWRGVGLLPPMGAEEQKDQRYEGQYGH